MNDCYFQHSPPSANSFTCFDGENPVCMKCCTESCPIKTPDWFLECSQAGHPTWPVVANNPDLFKPDNIEETSMAPNKMVCFEAYWTDQLFSNQTVKPFLDALKPLLNPPLEIAHRYIETIKGLKYYTQYPEGLLWKDQQSWDTPMFYLAFHGKPGTLKTVLEAVGPDLLCKAFARYGGYNTIIYFSACSLFKGSNGKKFADDLLRSSGVNAIVGYSEDVDWMDSMVIDMLFIKRFYSDANPFSNLETIYNSIIEDYKPAKKFGYKIFLRDHR